LITKQTIHANPLVRAHHPTEETTMGLLNKIELLKDMIQTSIDQGATTVEEVHQAIADMPFEILEKRGLLNDTASQLRDTQKATIGTVYGKIREINRLVGELASDMIGNVEDGQHISKVIDEKAD
jgi:hypothetical protein